MKKLSISMFGILAILFAVTSAFTTNKKTTFDEWYILKSSQIITPGSFESYFVQSRPINNVYVYEPTTFGNAKMYSVSDAELLCFGSDYVCAVEFDGADVNSSGTMTQSELTSFLAPYYVHPTDMLYKDE